MVKKKNRFKSFLKAQNEILPFSRTKCVLIKKSERFFSAQFLNGVVSHEIHISPDSSILQIDPFFYRDQGPML
jgi:hypothetical protein